MFRDLVDGDEEETKKNGKNHDRKFDFSKKSRTGLDATVDDQNATILHDDSMSNLKSKKGLSFKKKKKSVIDHGDGDESESHKSSTESEGEYSD